MIPRSRMSPIRASRLSSTPTGVTSSGSSKQEVVGRRAPRHRRGTGPARRGRARGWRSRGRTAARPTPGRAPGGRRRRALDRRGWFQNSRSRTRWTNVPRTVATVGEVGQVLDDGEPEGEGAVAERGDLGRGERAGRLEGHAVHTTARVCRIRGTQRPDGSGHGERVLERPEVAEPGQDLDASLAEARRHRLEERRPEGVGLGPAGQRDRAGHARQPGEGAVARRRWRRWRLRPHADSGGGRPGRHRPRPRGSAREPPRRRAGAPRDRARGTGGLTEKLTKASSADGKVSRRRRAPMDSRVLLGDEPRRFIVDEDDRLEAVERGEGARGGTPRPGRPPPRRTNGRRPAAARGRGGRWSRQHVVGESRPLEVAVRGRLGTAVGPEVDGPAVVAGRPGLRPEGRGQRRRSRWRGRGAGPAGAAEVVGGDSGAVAGGHPRGRVEAHSAPPSFGTHRRDGSRRRESGSLIDAKAGRREPEGSRGPCPARGPRLESGRPWSTFSRRGATWPSSS